MTLTISRKAEEKLVAVAGQEGIDPGALVEKLLAGYDSPIVEAQQSKNDAFEAWIASRLAHVPTDPEEQRRAQAEIDEFIQNLNANRLN